jgi:hypothetical protein
MPNLTPRNNVATSETEQLHGLDKLDLGHGIQLVHDPTVSQGKTKSMAKGLFLYHNGRTLAGESAGFGLPVYKSTSQTFFPSHKATRRISLRTMEKTFVLDRLLLWHSFGHRLPEWLNAINERLVSRYMREPGLQRSLLVAKAFLQSLFLTKNLMIPGPPIGVCRIIYEAFDGYLTVHFEGSSTRQPGRFILLNEVEGISFSRLRTGPRMQEGTEIPGWQNVTPNTILESPSLGVGFSIVVPGEADSESYHLAAGREIAHDLNWAGLAIEVGMPAFCYRVCFHFSGSLSG